MKPLRVLSLGAGVQSSTVLRMTLAGELEPLDAAIFADTGWEPPAVYAYLEELEREAAAAGLEIRRVARGNIRADALDPDHRFASMPLFVRKRDGSRGMVRRQCTGEYKLKPIIEAQRDLAGIPYGGTSKTIQIVSVIGISWDEASWMRDPYRRWIRHDYPLVDRRMTRAHCLAWNDAHGFARPPRSACIGCPFRSDAEWRHLRDNDPESWADAIAFDHAIRNGNVREGVQTLEGEAYLHAALVPLEEVDLSTLEDRGQLTFDLGCEGLCGL